jgi:hypothetical protein
VPFTILHRIHQDWELLRELQRVKLGQGKIKGSCVLNLNMRIFLRKYFYSVEIVVVSTCFAGNNTLFLSAYT